MTRFHCPVQPERFARLAEAFGLPSSAAVPDAVAGFVRRLAPDLSLASLGVPEADLPALADAVAADDQARFNSARAPDRDAALAILKEAFSA